MIPLGKRGKNPQECGDERPIALIDASAKILKAIVLNRIQSGLEPQLTPAQYAFRRARGTEMQLIEIYDFGQAGNRGDLQVYLASLDVSGAFDAASHEVLME